MKSVYEFKGRGDFFEKIFGKKMYCSLDRDTLAVETRVDNVRCNDPSILLAFCCNVSTTFTVSNCVLYFFPIPRASRSNPAVIPLEIAAFFDYKLAGLALGELDFIAPRTPGLRGCLFQFRRASARVRSRGAPKRTRLWGGDEGEIENRPAKREKRRP